MGETVCEYQPGLANIPAAQSGISFIDGDNSILEYRGVPIEELAKKKYIFRNCLFADLGTFSQ
jgi:citrate synthase